MLVFGLQIFPAFPDLCLTSDHSVGKQSVQCSRQTKINWTRTAHHKRMHISCVVTDSALGLLKASAYCALTAPPSNCSAFNNELGVNQKLSEHLTQQILWIFVRATL